jgi:hypothetical protein
VYAVQADALRNYEALSLNALSSISHRAKFPGITLHLFEWENPKSWWLVYLQKLFMKFLPEGTWGDQEKADICGDFTRQMRFGNADLIGYLGFRDLDKQGRDQRAKKGADYPLDLNCHFDGYYVQLVLWSCNL